MPESPNLTLLPSASPYSKGIFAGELLSQRNLESLQIIEKSLKKKILGIRLFLEKLKINPDLTQKQIQALKDESYGESLSIDTGGINAENRLLQDFQIFCSHDYAQLRDLSHGLKLGFLVNNMISGAQAQNFQHIIDNHTATLACFENLLSILNGEQNTLFQYDAAVMLRYYQELLERRFIHMNIEGLAEMSLVDKEGESVYAPYRIHRHVAKDLMLPGSTGAMLLMAMYNWAKNSITQGELRSKAYGNLKNNYYDAMGAMLEERIIENNGVIDVHMEIFETEEAYIGCVSDTGAGFDLNSLKKALRELTKDEEKMQKFLKMGIISEATFQAIHEWEGDPRAFGKILSDLPSLVKMPRFSSASDHKLRKWGLGHSGVGLSSIEVAAREHFATTFITEQHNGGACMIMVIPKDPDKYHKTAEDVSHETRTSIGDTLYRVPPHLKKAA